MSNTTESATIQTPRLRESLEAVRPEMTALQPDQLVTITMDPFMVASTARAALPHVMALRSQLEKLPGFDLNYLDKLERYALATLQAQNACLAASAPPEHFQELIAEATALREQFVSDVTALANRGFINGSPIDSLKGSVGHRNVASDLMVLATMLRTNWDKVLGKTGVSMAELDRAEVLGDQLSHDIGEKVHAPAVVAAVSLERQQAFTLLVNAYDQVRRAISYLRWNEDDIDEIAPSLYASRKRKASTDVSAKAKEATASQGQVGAGPAPVSAATAPTGTVSIAAPTGSPSTAAANPAAAVTKPAVGLPGADPFVH